MLQDAQAAIPLGFLLAFLVGPVFFVLLETAAIKGFRAALAVDLGVILADIAFILIAYFSTNKILTKIQDDPALFIFGGAILFTYGMINIGVLGFWLSIIIVIGPQLDMDTNRIIYFFAVVLITYLVVDVFKMLLAKRLKKKLTPKRTYTIKRIICIVMVVFGVFFILKGVVPKTVEQKIQDKIEKIKPESIK